MAGPQKPCENCGSTTFTHGTPGGRKGALTRALIDDPDGRLTFIPDAGTPVDVYACEGCGLIRLFAVEKTIPINVKNPSTNKHRASPPKRSRR